MADTKTDVSLTSAPPEKPLVGSSYVGPGVSGTGVSQVGVSGSSIAPPLPPGATRAQTGAALYNLMSDGVYGTGKNGVHGAGPVNGVLGENPSPASGFGVSGTSDQGTGVHGVNGTGSGVTPKFGCGVFGESDNGYGVYGASKAASGVYGTAPAGHLAGEFDGDIGVTGTVTATSAKDTGIHGINGAGSGAKPTFGCGVLGESDSGYGVYGASKTASGVYGTAPAGHFAGEFDGAVSVTGKVTVTGDHTVTGDATVTGNVTAKDAILSGSDCAEDFDVANAGRIEPGTVVVFDDDGAICQSTQAYNKRVAGVISGAGRYRPGVVLGRDGPSREGKAPVALAGRVYCKVDASYAPIEIGDMLTTSPTCGFAMKASDPSMAFGAVIGKALAPVQAGRKLIPILVTLQ